MANALSSYFKNPKVIVGSVLLLGTIMYMGMTFPSQWATLQTYQGQIKTNQAQLDQLKKSFEDLMVLSKSLEPVAKRAPILEINTNTTPQLQAFNVAQQVQKKALLSQVKILNSRPSHAGVLNVSSMITLKVANLPEEVSKPAPEAQGEAANDAVPTFSPEGVNFFEYEYTLQGSYMQLASFLYLMSELNAENLMITEKVSVFSEQSEVLEPGASANDLKMKLAVLVPFRFKKSDS
jgi:hypothetical protein